MRLSAPLCLVASLATGCERDPTFFGYWDLDQVTRGGVVQDDMGFLEILEDGSVAVFVRYTWSGGAFVPVAQPEIVLGTTDAVAQEPFGNYKTKGETYALLLEPFDATFDVTDYRGDRAELDAAEAGWPTGAGELAPTTLRLLR
jgi:hypothetical protein